MSNNYKVIMLWEARGLSLAYFRPTLDSEIRLEKVFHQVI